MSTSGLSSPRSSELTLQDNKCSWNINTALRYATPAQRQILDDNYGRKNPESEARVKALFSEAPISIPERYEAYEAEVYSKLQGLIGKVEEQGAGLKREVFESFLGKIYKRSK